jgi:glycosyltransferase involved in cell wall biosynthesis
MQDTLKTEFEVSVVIPSYNMAEYIVAAINSVIDGDFQAVEVIVVDDGSTDETNQIVRTYTDRSSPTFDSRVRYVRQSNKGKSAAVNRALSLARGDCIAMLDADDQFTSEGLSALYNARFDAQGNEFDLVIGGFEVFDDERVCGTRLPPDVSNPQKLHDRFYLRWKTPFHLNASLISRSLIDNVGGLDEHLHRCIDGDFALRLLSQATHVAVVDDIVYRYRKYRDSTKSRLRYRLKTALYRPRVVWKNYSGIRRWAAVPFGIAMDMGKMVYEIFNSYKA